MNVLIVGCGIGGLATAVSLRKAGIEPNVCQSTTPVETSNVLFTATSITFPLSLVLGLLTNISHSQGIK